MTTEKEYNAIEIEILEVFNAHNLGTTEGLTVLSFLISSQIVRRTQSGHELEAVALISDVIKRLVVQILKERNAPTDM